MFGSKLQSLRCGQRIVESSLPAVVGIVARQDSPNTSTAKRNDKTKLPIRIAYNDGTCDNKMEMQNSQFALLTLAGTCGKNWKVKTARVYKGIQMSPTSFKTPFGILNFLICTTCFAEASNACASALSRALL